VSNEALLDQLKEVYVNEHDAGADADGRNVKGEGVGAVYSDGQGT